MTDVQLKAKLILTFNINFQ